MNKNIFRFQDQDRKELYNLARSSRSGRGFTKVATSVTRFGDISPLWQNYSSRWEVFGMVWYLANFCAYLGYFCDPGQNFQ